MQFPTPWPSPASTPAAPEWIIPTDQIEVIAALTDLVTGLGITVV